MQNNIRQRNNLGQFVPNLSNQNQKQNGFPLIPPNQPLNQLSNQIMATYDLNPYNGNINLSTNDGLKLFLKSTEEHKGDARLKCSQSNVKNLMSAL